MDCDCNGGKPISAVNTIQLIYDEKKKIFKTDLQIIPIHKDLIQIIIDFCLKSWDEFFLSTFLIPIECTYSGWSITCGLSYCRKNVGVQMFLIEPNEILITSGNAGTYICFFCFQNYFFNDDFDLDTKWNGQYTPPFAKTVKSLLCTEYLKRINTILVH